MTLVLSDLRFALRTMRRSPGFTTIAILSIALGIGANTAIFTLVDQVLLRVLPVKNPQQLVQVTQDGDLYGSNWGDGTELSYPTTPRSAIAAIRSSRACSADSATTCTSGFRARPIAHAARSSPAATFLFSVSGRPWGGCCRRLTIG